MIWKWVKRIGALKSKKIVFDEVAEAANLETFTHTVDGMDFNMYEPKQKTLPKDTKACSQKFNHAAAKYEVTMSVHRAKCVHIAGRFKGGGT